MHIDFCLVSSDLNEKYVGLYPYVKKSWKKIGIDTKLILVASHIPDILKEYEEDIIIFPPIENMHTAFQAQCIRLLYPCLYSDKNILVSDMDIIPLSKKYFIDSVSDIDNGKFIIYRDSYINNEMFAICYNLANSTIWKNIFLINNICDINNTLNKWYNNSYNGIKNCEGWFSDQKMLYKYIIDYKNAGNEIIILGDKNLNFNRLDKRKRAYILNNLDQVYKDIKDKKYIDFHVIRPYYKYTKIIENIINLIDI